MKTAFPAVLLALAALAALPCPLALAGADATVRIEAVTLGVIDLTPDDGASAGFTIDSAESRLLVYVNTFNSGGSYTQTAVSLAANSAGRIQLPASAGADTVVATTNGAVGDVAAHTATGAGLGLDNYVGAESQQYLWLTLAPHSLLTVSGSVFAQARRTMGAGEGYGVFGWASVDISDDDMTTTSMLTRESSLIWGEAATLAERQEHFLLAYANPGDADLRVNLNFLAYTDVTVTAVPEPSTYALLLAGLLLITTIARRQLRGQCRHSDTTSSLYGPARV
jgi:hypothetical protein